MRTRTDERSFHWAICPGDELRNSHMISVENSYICINCPNFWDELIRILLEFASRAPSHMALTL